MGSYIFTSEYCYSINDINKINPAQTERHAWCSTCCMLLKDFSYALQTCTCMCECVGPCVSHRYRLIDTVTCQQGDFDHPTPPNPQLAHTRTHKWSQPISHCTVRRTAGCQYTLPLHTHSCMHTSNGGLVDHLSSLQRFPMCHVLAFPLFRPE